jgi:hypothetical protein
MFHVEHPEGVTVINNEKTGQKRLHLNPSSFCSYLSVAFLIRAHPRQSVLARHLFLSSFILLITVTP